MFRATWKGLTEARRRFQKMQRNLPRKLTKVLALGQKEAHSALIKAISGPGGETTLNPAKARRLIRMGRRPSAGQKNRRAYVNVKGDRIGLHDYAAVEIVGQGVVAKIRRNEPSQMYPSAFEWRGSYWQRQRYGSVSARRLSKGDVTEAPSGLVGRLPIVRLEGPRVTSLVANVEAIRNKTAQSSLRVMVESAEKALRI